MPCKIVLSAGNVDKYIQIDAIAQKAYSRILLSKTLLHHLPSLLDNYRYQQASIHARCREDDEHVFSKHKSNEGFHNVNANFKVLFVMAFITLLL